MMHIHYRPDDGEIVGWETGTVQPVGPDGTRTIAVQIVGLPDPAKEKIDPSTLVIVEKTSLEKAQALQPTERELKQAVFAALSATDHMMLPDRDDILPQDRAKWAAYRKSLRDLSKGDPRPNAAAMIVAWPLDPDGKDAIENLRNRNQ